MNKNGYVKTEYWKGKAYKTFVKESMSSQMSNQYYNRTDRHVGLVHKYCHLIADKFPEFEELRQRAIVHDDSKYKEPELSPYMFITWKYYCADTGLDFQQCNPPDNIDELMMEATHHHVTTNSHHPEYHSPDKTNLINRENRDKPPKKMVDATSMPRLDIAEMVADWSAMGEERGNSAKEWADKNVNIRWKFTDEQVELMYEIMERVK